MREAQRVKEMQGERRHIFNSPFTFASRSLLFLLFSVFLSFPFRSLISLLKGGPREAVEQTEGK